MNIKYREEMGEAATLYLESKAFGHTVNLPVQMRWAELFEVMLAAAAPSTQQRSEEYSDDIEKNWSEFWEPIVAPDGVLDLQQVKAELSDFRMILHNVPKVYMHVTGGRVSKPNTDVSAVCAVADDYMDEVCARNLNEHVPEDFITHRHTWRLAMEECRDRGSIPTPENPDQDDRGFWEHELAAFDAAYVALLLGGGE